MAGIVPCFFLSVSSNSAGLDGRSWIGTGVEGRLDGVRLVSRRGRTVKVRLTILTGESDQHSWSDAGPDAHGDVISPQQKEQA
jgi:hypothetical protein